MKRLRAITLAATLVSLAPSTAFALGDGGPDESAEAQASDASPLDAAAVSETPKVDQPGEVAGEMYEAVRAGKWMVAGGFLLMLVVWLLQLGLGRVSGFFRRRFGKRLIAFGSALLLTVATAMSSGAGLSGGVFLGAIAAAWAAGGAWEMLKDAVAYFKGDAATT